MKKLSAILIILIISISIGFGAISPQIGDKIGDVLYTDIVTEINGQEVESFNINGSTAIYVTQTKKLGYDVAWNGEERLVEVTYNSSNNPSYNEEKLEKANTLNHRVGDKINDVLYTDIRTIIDGIEFESFNINGSTAIYAADLREAGAEVKWNGDDRRVIISNVGTNDDTEEESTSSKIATFNVLHLGWNNDKNYNKLAQIIDNFELVGLVEVMKEDGLIQLANTLNSISDREWSYHISSQKVGRSSYKEYYGYVYSDNVTFLESEGFFEDSEDIFEREPYGASFKIDKMDFTLVLLHSIYGDSKSEREYEAQFLDNVYYNYQISDKNENDVFIGGDFNLPATSPYFDLTNLDDNEFALNPIQKTSIGNTGLVSEYDNIFLSKYSKPSLLHAGVYDFTDNDYSVVRKSVSDHLPVYLELNTSVDDDIFETSIDEPDNDVILSSIDQNATSTNTNTENNTSDDVEITAVSLSDEYIIIKNNSNSSINLTGWTIVSVTGNQTYEFPYGYTLGSGSSVKIVSGRGAEGNGSSVLKWTGSYIWNNEGDPAELRNPNDSIVDRY